MARKGNPISYFIFTLFDSIIKFIVKEIKKIRYLILSESDEPPLAFPFRDSDSERESVHS